MRRFLAIASVFAAGLVVLASACGGDNGANGDGGPDGTVTDGNGSGDGQPTDGGGGSDGSLFGDGNPNCTPLGIACKSATDCCSGNCANGACQPPTCTGDNLACTTSSQCCSGTCTNGTCTPLNTTCKTLGNPCTSGVDCCSNFCSNGVCAQPSYCGQNGDICATNGDCCGGLCTKAPNATFGICDQPKSGGCTMDGFLCGGTTADGGATYTDGGLPTCGGSCCSRACAPWGPTSVLICQPASGCHPIGDICAQNSDCCGGNDPKSGYQCIKSGTNPVGVCGQGNGCKPNGDICRLQSNQCNATDNCCSGNVQQNDTCHQDNLGVPRCSYAGDGGNCVPSSGTCASSADCCNLNPCVPSGDGGFTCYPGACVPTQGACTNDADCCPGGHCYIQSGHTSGLCVSTSLPDGGTTSDGGVVDSGVPCSLYGQTCTTSSDCCNNVPCTSGRCIVPVN
jgi:hypothetical protein